MSVPTASGSSSETFTVCFVGPSVKESHHSRVANLAIKVILRSIHCRNWVASSILFFTRPSSNMQDRHDLGGLCSTRHSCRTGIDYVWGFLGGPGPNRRQGFQ